MRIQVITNRNMPASKITTSKMSSPKSLDEFEVDVIDLTDAELWKNDDNNYTHINAQNDFLSIQTMVERKSSAKIVYILPQNVAFNYYCSKSGGTKHYFNKILLKDQIYEIKQRVISSILPKTYTQFQLIYENTRTKINGQIYEADFYFETLEDGLTSSDLSNKKTTIRISGKEIYATTMKICNSEDELFNFLSFLFNKHEIESAPTWLSTIAFGDDNEQKCIIRENEEVIRSAQKRIDAANAKLEENEEYKSILYTNGDELVRVVFKILEKLLVCDLSDFIDEKKEDFLIKKENCTLIGEIKGVTSNVKSEHISQLDVHYQGYMDHLQEEHRSEKVFQLLIINAFRTKEPSQREPIHETQVALAKRNKCLIIETVTLLHIFEEFLNGTISSEKCVEVFSTHTGLLEESDLILQKTTNLEDYKV